MKKQLIAVDLDDTLAASAKGLIGYSNQKWNLQLTLDHYSENWAEMWGVSLEEAIRRGEDFHKSDSIAWYQAIANKAVLKRLSARYDLVVLTSRRVVLRDVTTSWIARNYPDIFANVHFAGIWDDVNADDALARLAHTKAEICRLLNVDILIDDQPKHCMGAAQAGIRSILFGDYPWNRDNTIGHENLSRALTWADMERVLHG